MKDASASVEVIHNEERQRFEATVGEHTGRIEYRMMRGKIAFLHTEVPPELEGLGIASSMAKTALDYAREHQLRVLPYCPFVAAYIKRHPEYQDLVD